MCSRFHLPTGIEVVIPDDMMFPAVTSLPHVMGTLPLTIMAMPHHSAMGHAEIDDCLLSEISGTMP